MRNVSRRGLGCDWVFSAHRCTLSYSYGNQSQRLIQRPRDLKTCTAPLDGALQTRGTPPRATQAHRRDHHNHGGPRGRGTRLDRAFPAFPPRTRAPRLARWPRSRWRARRRRVFSSFVSRPRRRWSDSPHGPLFRFARWLTTPSFLPLRTPLPNATGGFRSHSEEEEEEEGRAR